MRETARAWAPPTVPSWRATSIVLGWAIGLIAACVALAGPAGAPVAVGGFSFGAMGLAARPGPARAASMAFGALAVLAALVVPAVAPLVLMALLVGLALEVDRHGSLRLLLGVFAAVTAHVGVGLGGAAAPLAVCFLGGLVAGAAAIRTAGLAGLVPPLPPDQRRGTEVAVLLGIGLVMAAGTAALLPGPRAYWVAYIFVMRAALPLHRQRAGAYRYAKGAIIGVALALGIELVQMPEAVRLALALALAGLSLRYILHPAPVSAAALTAAVLLAGAPTPVEAMWRLAAIGLAVGIVVIATILLDRIWHRVVRRAADPAPGGSGGDG
jgi:hypothetical protein